MGSGKTATGQVLATKLGWQFVDVDRACEKCARMNIAEIFAYRGEAAFRKYEARQIDRLRTAPQTVVATGGGVVLTPKNRQHMTACGCVVFLDAHVATQVARTRNDVKRPLLARGNPYTTLRKLYRERKPLYQAVADWTLATDREQPTRIADRIICRLQHAT